MYFRIMELPNLAHQMKDKIAPRVVKVPSKKSRMNME
jgi:hypothetical protein